MYNYKGVIPFLIETAKKKGVRLEEADFDNPDIECLNQHVVIFRRSACQIINGLFEGGESGSTAHQMTEDNLLPLTGNDGGMLHGSDKAIGVKGVHRLTLKMSYRGTRASAGLG